MVFTLHISTMVNVCIECNLEVKSQQDAVPCDYCERWQHRLCGTGIPVRVYHEAIRAGHWDWVCGPCLVAINDPQEDNQAEQGHPLGPFQGPLAVVQPDTIVKLPISTEVVHNRPPTEFELIPHGTKRGGDLLVSSDGYSYTRKVDNRQSRKQRWRCANYNGRCRATLKEDMGRYIPGPQQHVCAPNPNRGVHAKIIRDAKQQAVEESLVSARSLVDNLIQQHTTPDNMHQLHGMSSSTNIARCVGHLRRKKQRQEDLGNSNFTRDRESTEEDSMKGDIWVEDERSGEEGNPLGPFQESLAVEEPDTIVELLISTEIVHNPPPTDFEADQGHPLGPSQEPLAVEEPDTVVKLPISTEIVHNRPPTEFELIHHGTNRGGDLLVSSDGYSYTRKVDNRRSRKQRWRCANYNGRCRATLKEDMGRYIPGPQQHVCTPNPNRGIQAKIIRDAKQQAVEESLVSARSLVDNSIQQHTTPDNMHQLHGMLSSTNIVKCIGHLRRKKQRHKNSENCILDRNPTREESMAGDIWVEDEKGVRNYK